MKTILLPTDFSNNARHAIDYTIALFGPECNYILLHAFQTPQAGATMLYSINDMLEAEAREALDHLAIDLLDQHGKQLNIERQAVLGDVFAACKRVAELKHVDLIAMGTKGATGLKETFLGSNTASAIQWLDYPILAIPREASTGNLDHIVLATDYHDMDGNRVFDPLRSVIQRTMAELTIVHVEMEGVPAGGEHKTVDRETWLRHLSGINYDLMVVEEEDVLEGLQSFIEENRPDMLAMVEHHYPFFERLFHRSLTKHMAMHTRIPLLVLTDTTQPKSGKS